MKDVENVIPGELHIPTRVEGDNKWRYWTTKNFNYEDTYPISDNSATLELTIGTPITTSSERPFMENSSSESEVLTVMEIPKKEAIDNTVV